MKIITMLIGVMLLAACATQDVSPTQSYRPAGSEELWTITGNLDSTMGLMEANRQLHVFINAEEVINGRLSGMAVGELSGNYQGRSVVANCSSEQVTRNWVEVRCMILIDNERAATLTF